MANYDFSTLNSSDLEELVCDLLNAQERSNNSGIIFKTFKDGKDKGIDIRFSTSTNSNEIVGQIKHYYRSGYDALLQVLKNNEKEKVKKLNPNRYVFATSVDLSVFNSEEIQKVFSPHIKSLSDINGLKDLNRMLTAHSEVLNSHFKLWFSGTEVLQKVLNYQIEGRSYEFEEIELKKRLRLYVHTSSLSEALYKLKKNNFVIITGEPGSGKTTTAEMLLYELIKEDYELVYIYDDIKEAEKKLSSDDKKQVFYYDDFLGHNSVEIAKAKGSETTLIKILKRINNSVNKKFIFTTRTFILNSAIEDSEKLRQFNIKAKESKMQLSVYTNDIKRQMLHNHIEESSLSNDLKNVLKSEKILSFIISHSSFSPRSIEFITTEDNVGHFSPSEFETFIIQNFNAPDEIWRHAFEQQINSFDRFMLNTMVSFGNSVHIEQLEMAFNTRLDYEVQFNNYERPMSAFKSSFRRLEGGFIIEYLDYPGWYQFINPSLTDFLVKNLQKNRDEVHRISESCCFISQLTSRMFPVNNIDQQLLKGLLSSQLKKKLLLDNGFFIKEESKDQDKLLLAILLHKYIDLSESEHAIIKLLSTINCGDFITEDPKIGFYLQYFLEAIESVTVREKVKDLASVLFPPLLYIENDLDNLMGIMRFCSNKYTVDLSNILHANQMYNFSEKLTELLNERIEDDIEELLSSSMPQNLVNAKERKTQDIIDYCLELNIPTHATMHDYSRYDWQEVGMDNYFNGQMAMDD
jgi:energy-coupling factor transporter ATP-binding protein EcfA2